MKIWVRRAASQTTTPPSFLFRTLSKMLALHEVAVFAATIRGTLLG